MSQALCSDLYRPFNPLHPLSQEHDRYPHFTGGAPEPPWTTEPLTITASAKKEGTRPGDAELRPGPLDIGPRLGPGTREGLSPHGHCRPDGCKGGFHASAVGLRLSHAAKLKRGTGAPGGPGVQNTGFPNLRFLIHNMEVIFNNNNYRY